MSATVSKTISYMPQLDGLRALAVAVVIVQHWIPEHQHANIQWGVLGVQLFFVLSGFLITGILLHGREQASAWSLLSNFYARRFLRIFPLYYAVLAITFIAGVKPIPETFWWHASYLSNVYFFFVAQDWNGAATHFWTLAVEEQFYMFWPFLILFWPRRSLKAMIVAVIVIGAVFRLAMQIKFPEMRSNQSLLFSNLDALALGSLLSLPGMVTLVRTRAKGLCLGCVAAFIVLQVLATGGYDLPAILYSLRHETMLGTFALIIATASVGFRGPLGSVLTWSPLMYIGRISYGIYILHMFGQYPIKLVCGVFDWPMPSFWLEIAIKLPMVFVGASLSWHFFERPLNNLKKHFQYRETKPVAELPATQAAN